MDGIAVIVAKFRGVCTWCGGPIQPGERMGYDPKQKRRRCARCLGEQRAGTAKRKQAEHLAALRLG